MTPGLVVVDGRLLHRPVSGLERYVSSLTSALGRHEERPNLALTVDWPVRISPELARRCLTVPVHNNQHLVETIKSGPECIYHLTWLGYSAAHYLPLAVASASLLTIPDFILWDHPEYSSPELHSRYRIALRECLGWAHRILVYSEHTKDQAIDRLGVAPERVGVVQLGADERFALPCDDSILDARRREVGGRFILSVGKDYPHKNLERLIRGFAASGLKAHKLAIVGEAVWSGGRQWLLTVARAHRVENQIVFLDHVLDLDLPSFYQASEAFVFPSLEEGFGLPPLEAMASGVPVICSKAASLPEVVEDAAVLVDATDVAALASAMREVIDDTSLRDDLIRRGRERAQTLTWEQSAELTFQNYQTAAAASSLTTIAPRAGSFLRYFYDDLPLIDRFLGDSTEHPRAECLAWVAENDPPGTSDSGTIADLRREAIDTWLRERSAATGSVDVVLTEDVSEQVTLAAAIDFASPQRVLVVGQSARSITLSRGITPEITPCSRVELIARLTDDAGSNVKGALSTLQSNVLVVDLPARFADSLNLSDSVTGAFSIDMDRPLSNPELWLDEIMAKEARSSSGFLLVADSRATLNATWVNRFRDGLRKFSSRQVMWLGASTRVQSSIDSLAEADAAEWVIFPLDGLNDEDCRILNRRRRLRLAVIVTLARSDPEKDGFERLIARAWQLKADAAIFDPAPSDTVSNLVEATKHEIEAAAVESQRGDEYGHMLQLRRELLESRRRERAAYEEALRSHLEAVKSYQEQLDRCVSQMRAMERSVASVVSRFVSR